MKKKTIFLLILLLLGLTSCQVFVDPGLNNKYIYNLNSKDVTLYYVDDSNEVLEKDFVLYFKNNSVIPYINLKDTIFILEHALQYNDTNLQYDYEIKNGEFIYNNSNGYECILNQNYQTIYSEEFSMFIPLAKDLPGLYSIEEPTYSFLSADPIHTEVEDLFIPGEYYFINLEDYDNENIALLYDEGEYFLPLATFNDVFLASETYNFIKYDFEDVYLFNYDNLFPGTPLYNIYEDVEKKEYYDLEYSKFSYHELVLLMDNQYGNNIARNMYDFDEFFTNKGLKDAFYSGNALDIDQVLLEVFRIDLYDRHTVHLFPSPFINSEELSTDKVKAENTYYTKIREYTAKCEELKKAAGIDVYDFKIIGNTAFIAFDGFMDFSGEEFVVPNSLEEVTDTMSLFLYAYHQIINNDQIENVVFDITTNSGGSTHSLLYTLSMICGVSEYIIKDTKTHTTYVGHTVADLDLDGVFDTKGLVDLGYNVSILTTEVSFSCGNAFPVFAKETEPGITIIGSNSGGGTCVISPAVTATGSTLVISSSTQLVKERNGKYVNIEEGCPVDIYEDIEQLVDYEYIYNLVNKK